MDKDYANYLLTKTKKDYNKIAKQFSASRNHVWEEITPLFDKIKGGEVLDVGCGNGRFFKIFKEEGMDYVGVDFSSELVKIAKDKYPEGNFRQADGLDLPFSGNSFEAVVSIAVLHHIPSFDLRLKFLKEIKRVLKDEGIVILTVWRMPFWKRLKLLLRFSFRKICGVTKLDFKDVFVPWGEVKRYIHIFSERELRRLVKKAGFKIKESGKKIRDNGQGNIYIVAEK